MDPNRPRPPYLRFERKVVQYKTTEGAVAYRDADFVHVTPIGSRDTVVREFPDWIASQKILVQHERQDPDWIERWERQYEAWKKGEELPVDGTPLRACPAFLPAEIARAGEIGIHTVEDLAAANVEAQTRLGMGAVSMVMRAKDWLTAASDTAPLVAQVDSLRTTNQALERTNKELAARITALEAAIQPKSQMASASSLLPSLPATPAPSNPLDRLQIAPDNDGDLVDKAIDEML